MIFEMAANIRLIDGDGDAEGAKFVSRADAGQHQETRRIDGPRAEQHLDLGPHDTLGNPHSDAALVLHQQTKHLRAGQDRKLRGARVLMPRSIYPAINDILETIDRVQSKVAGKTLTEFRGDWELRFIVERAIESYRRQRVACRTT
jgi:hypothetical protein